MYLIDTHCHLDFEDFNKDREEAIKRAKEGGVEKIINIGCNLERAKKSLEIANKYDFVYVSVGLHPQEAGKGNEKLFVEMEKLLKEPKVVAAGECGIEIQNSKVKTDLDRQKDVFRRQIESAIKFNKPIIIHCRNAFQEVLEILREEKKKNQALSGVMHFFSGRMSQAEELFKLGFLISFTGVITFARDYDKVIKNAPFDKIMVETDAPFVAPVPFRGQRCEPLHVKYVAEKIAEIRGVSLEEVANETTKNAEKLFNL